MATAYLSRRPSRYESTMGFQERHIPVKRIAPCPSSDLVVAKAKRSRLIANQSMATRPSGLVVRGSNCNVENHTSAKCVAWTSENCFQGHSGPACLPKSKTLATPIRGLQYNPVSCNSIARQSMTRASSGANGAKKSGCCPSLLSSNGYSTPPYRLESSNKEGRDGKRCRKRPLSQRLRRRSADKKIKPTSCFDVVASTTVGKVNSAQERFSQKAAPQPRMNALSVYHSFLRQREGEMKFEKSVDMPTCTTTASTKKESVRETSSRYSSNFIPQLTSTPQKRKSSMVGGHSGDGAEFKVPAAPPSSSKRGQDDGTLDEVLKALEEEREMGSSHILLPLSELTNMVKDLQQKHREDEGSNSSCSGSAGTTVSNNNNDDLHAKTKPVFAKPTLPGIYPIGAPRAASSPIAIPARKRGNAISDDLCFGNPDAHSSMLNSFANNESAFSVGMTAGATDVWRPW